LGKPGGKWDDDIKMDSKEMWCEDVDWIRLAQTGSSGWFL